MIFSQIQLGLPSIWLKTSDIYRSIENIINFDNRDYFTINTDKGFSKFIDNQWKSILVEIPDRENPDRTIETITHDFTVAYHYMNSDKSGLVSKNPLLYMLFQLSQMNLLACMLD